MPKLIIQDSLKLTRPKIIPVENGATIDSVLRGEFPRFEFGLNTLLLNDVKILPNDPYLYNELKGDDVLTVIQEVKGVFSGFLGLASNLLGGVLEFALGGLIDIPGAGDTDQSSPNNNFGTQTNVMRAFSQLPVVVGSPRVYPDLAGDAIEFYSNNVKQSEQTFIVSYGTFSGGETRAGNTLIQRFNGSTATRYLPDETTKITTIPNYRIGSSVDEVDGQTILGTNEGVDGSSYSTFQGGTTDTTYSGSVFTAYVSKTTESDLLKASFDAGNTSFSVEYDRTASNGGVVELVPAFGTGVITSMNLEQSNSVYKIVVSKFNGEYSADDNYYASFLFTEKLDNTIGPFVNPIQCEKMFFNIKFDRGLKNTVPITVDVYELDEQGGARTGVTQQFNVSYTEKTLDATYFTFEVNISNGRSWYEFDVRRTNESSEKTDKPDIATLEKVFCIQELGDFDFYNVTMLQVKMPTTQIPTGTGVDTKINIQGGMQMMPSYDLSTKAITADATSRSFADAILYVWRDFLGKDTSKLNLDELYTIEKSIINSYGEEFTYFDYTYDDVEQSAGERIDMALNVARCGRYNDANQIRFWRDEKVDFPSTLLSRADIASESDRSYKLSRANYVDGDYDSVQVEYVDRDLNKKAYVYLRISGGAFVEGTGENPKKITLTGCQSEAVAINRADLEIRKMVYNRWTLSDTFIDAHRMRDKGDVVIYNEVYENVLAGGDVVAINGNSVVTSNKIELESGESYQVYFTNLYGDIVGPVSMTSNGPNDITVASLDSEVFPRGFEGAQLGSRYLAVKLNDTINRQYRVVEKETSGYNVQISMINYDERVYENDPS